VVLFTSPLPTNYKFAVHDLRLGPNFYVPLWSFDELRVMYPNLTQDAFDAVGGVPRHIDGSNGCASARALHAQNIAISTYNYTSFEAVSEQVLGSSAVLSIIPADDYLSYTFVDFNSRGIAKRWTEKKCVSDLTQVELAINTMLANSTLRVGHAGYMFEAWALVMLSAMSHNQGVLLTDLGTVMQPKTDFDVYFAPGANSRVYFDALSEIKPTTVPTLMIPRIPNFPIVDAFIVSGCTVVGIQVTIAESHKLKPNALEKFKVHFEKTRLTLSKMIWITDGKHSFCAQGLESSSEATADVKKSANEFFDRVPQYRLVMPVKYNVRVSTTWNKAPVTLLYGNEGLMRKELAVAMPTSAIKKISDAEFECC
jgi:hypothetical protein